MVANPKALYNTNPSNSTLNPKPSTLSFKALKPLSHKKSALNPKPWRLPRSAAKNCLCNSGSFQRLNKRRIWTDGKRTTKKTRPAGLGLTQSHDSPRTQKHQHALPFTRPAVGSGVDGFEGRRVRRARARCTIRVRDEFSRERLPTKTPQHQRSATCRIRFCGHGSGPRGIRHQGRNLLLS